MSHDEYENDPIPGLPELLPAGETLLWQGSPSATSIARRALHAGKVAVYFAALALLSVVLNVQSGASVGEVAAAALTVALVGAAAIAVLAALARAIARTTIYSITSHRVVMRLGVALPMTFNLPYKQIGSVDLKLYADGSGDIALATLGDKRLGFVHLWPHVRGWRLRNPEPVLRGLSDAKSVAEILTTAMRSAMTAGERQAAEVVKRPAAQSVGERAPVPLPSGAVAA